MRSLLATKTTRTQNKGIILAVVFCYRTAVLRNSSDQVGVRNIEATLSADRRRSPSNNRVPYAGQYPTTWPCTSVSRTLNFGS